MPALVEANARARLEPYQGAWTYAWRPSGPDPWLRPGYDTFERYATSLPSERNLEIAFQLIKKAADAGAESMEDCAYYLDGEFELLLAIMGKRMPIRLDEFANALTAFVLARAKNDCD